MFPTTVATVIPMELTTMSATAIASTSTIPPNTTGQHGRYQKH